MGIKRCKLPRKLQLRLLENFVLQVTARSAADLHGIQANTVALFYRKIRLVIAEKLEAEAVPFAGEIEVEESYFGGVRKGPRGRGLLEKFPCMDCSSAAAKCMRCRSQTPEKKLSCRLSGGK
jgi:transposase